MQDYATGYQGPAIVACADGPSRLWVRYKGSVVRVAIENVRLATEEEEEVATSFIREAMAELEHELTGGRRAPGYEDLAEEEVEPGRASEAPHPGPPSEAQPHFGNSVDQAEQHSAAAPAAPSTVEVVPPQPPAQVPEPTKEIVSLAKQSEDRRRQLDGLPPKHRAGPYDPVKASVPQRIAFFERGGKEDTWQSIWGDVSSKLELASASHLQRFSAEKDAQHVHREIQAGLELSARQRDEGGEAMLKSQRVEDIASEPGVSALAPLVADALMASEAWALKTSTSTQECDRLRTCWRPSTMMLDRWSASEVIALDRSQELVARSTSRI